MRTDIEASKVRYIPKNQENVTPKFMYALCRIKGSVISFLQKQIQWRNRNIQSILEF